MSNSDTANHIVTRAGARQYAAMAAEKMIAKMNAPTILVDTADFKNPWEY